MTFKWNPRVFDDAMRMAARGLQAATIYATNCTKEILSVPAPRVTFTDKTGARYYKAGFKLNDRNRMGPGNFDASRAEVKTELSFKFPKGGVGPPELSPITYQTAPAIKGEPPRKLSGALRRSVTYEFLGAMKTFEGGDIPTTGRVGTNIKYAKRLEFGPGDHEFLHRVFRERRKEIEQVLYDNAGGAAI